MNWKFIFQIIIFILIVYLASLFGVAWILCFVLAFLWQDSSQDLKVMYLIDEENMEKIETLQAIIDRHAENG